MSARKPLKSTLDLFLVALIDEGVNSFYDFRQQAGLSLGATSPAIARLQDQGFITDSTSGPRGKVKYRLTTAGKRALQTGWGELVDFIAEKPAETESILRLVAMSGAGERHRVTRLIRQTIVDRKTRIAEISRFSVRSNSKVAVSYRQLLLRLEQERLRADIRVFRYLRPTD